jgi:hypothetical protein
MVSLRDFVMNRQTLFFASLALFVACSNGNGGAPDASSDASGDAGKPLAPTTLRGFETDAEGISDACKVLDWTKAQGVLGEANTNWSTLRAQVQAAGWSASMLAQVDTDLTTVASDITAHAQKACETDANVITLAVPDMFDLFTWPVPSDALRGDGVFRQLQIDGEYTDWARTSADLTATKMVWMRLKPLAQAKAPMRPDIPGTATVVADMDAAIQKCETAIGALDGATLQTASQSGLDAVDVVEQMFN